MSTETKALRNKAADLIEERGWTQGLFVDAAGCLCMDGALMAADHRIAAHHDGPSRTYMAAYMELSEELSDGPIAWNDVPGRTAAEVIAALRGTS